MSPGASGPSTPPAPSPPLPPAEALAPTYVEDTLSDALASQLAFTAALADQTVPGSAQLLRRCVSEEELGGEGLGNRGAGGSYDDGESEFESDEEPFRMRPPSIASSTTSRRSSRFGVHLEDRSDRACAAFAKEVRVKGFYPVGDKAGGFVVYDIEVTSREGTVLHALKRYSAFVQLRNDLLRALPNLKGQIPRLPPKSSLSKYRPSFLERRRQQLGFWLTSVLLHPEAGASTIMRAWVLE